jgi:3-deoxy-D-manno-octulosonate 8-phosphate phosphatase (KDO 8-P phosphatase)
MPSTRGPRSTLRKIKMLLLDVDGVMTDGGLYYSADGIELKRFHAHDGYGIVQARQHGITLAIISGRSSTIVEARARVLEIDEVYLNAMDKVTPFRELQKKYGVTEEETAFVGDDVFDLPLLEIVGFSAAPKNAMAEVKRRVDYVTSVSGGNGAVREVVDLILAAQRR